MRGLYEQRRLYIENKRKTLENSLGDAIFIPKFSDKTENQLAKAIVTFIKLNNGQAERINSTIGHLDNQILISDISATIKGRSVKIRVKIGGDKISAAQIKCEESVKVPEIIYYEARNFESFYSWYNANLREGGK